MTKRLNLNTNVYVHFDLRLKVTRRIPAISMKLVEGKAQSIEEGMEEEAGEGRRGRGGGRREDQKVKQRAKGRRRSGVKAIQGVELQQQERTRQSSSEQTAR